MLIKRPEDCDEFTANDGCRIRELVHPDNNDPDLPYSLAVARVAAGSCTYQHVLKQTEVYYILQGSGNMHIDDEVEAVHAGEAVVIPGGKVQWIENDSDIELRFIAIVSPPWTQADDMRLES